MLWHINKKCHFNGFSKATQILHISSTFKHFFFAYLIVLNPTISHERDRYVKSVMYKNHKFPVCFGNTSIS